MARAYLRFCLAAVASSCGLGAATDSARAGAFTLAPGEAKLFATATSNSGDRYFDAAGQLRKREPYRKRELQFYGEYGVRDGATVFGAAGLQRIDARDHGASSYAGLGRTEIGLRYRLFEKGGWIVSAQGSGILAGARPSAGVAAVGETDNQIDGRLLLARGFEAFGKQGFVDFAGGYRMRNGDPADELRFDATLGLRVTPRLLMLAQSFNTIGRARWSGPYPLKQRIHKLQGGAMFDLTKRWTLVGAAFVTPAARDALDEGGATVGLGLKF